MTEQKLRRILAAFCAVVTALVGCLALYMRHLARQYPSMPSLSRNTYIAGALFLAWLAMTIWFAVQSGRKRKDRKK